MKLIPICSFNLVKQKGVRKGTFFTIKNVIYHVRKANISHLHSKYFIAKRFRLPEWANFIGSSADADEPNGTFTYYL